MAARAAHSTFALLQWMRCEIRLGSPRLSDAAVRLVAVLASYVDAPGDAWPSMPTLADDVGTSVRTVQRAMAELLEHPRAPIRRELGVYHDSPTYKVTAWAQAAYEGRGPYSAHRHRHRPVEAAPPKGIGADRGEPAGADLRPAGVTDLSPLNPTGSVRLPKAARASIQARRGDMRVTPIDATGVTKSVNRGDKTAHVSLELPELPVERTAAAVMAAAEQQQRGPSPEQLAEAASLVSRAVAARDRRRSDRQRDGDTLQQLAERLPRLSADQVIGWASAFEPSPGRVVQAARLDGMSPAYAARTLLELRRFVAREEDLARQLAEDLDRREAVRDDDPSTLLGDAHAARSTWDLIAGEIARKLNRHSYATWFRPLDPVTVLGSSLYVRVPTAQFSGWLGANYAGVVDESVAAVGLTCRVVFGTVRELRAALAEARVPPNAREEAS